MKHGYTVTQLADIAGISPRTLRYYDQIGTLYYPIIADRD